MITRARDMPAQAEGELLKWKNILIFQVKIST